MKIRILVILLLILMALIITNKQLKIYLLSKGKAVSKAGTFLVIHSVEHINPVTGDSYYKILLKNKLNGDLLDLRDSVDNDKHWYSVSYGAIVTLTYYTYDDVILVDKVYINKLGGKK